LISKVGPKGQIVVPKELRDELGIGPGSSVSLRWRPDGRTVELTKAWDDPIVDGPMAIQRLTRPKHRGRSATEDFLAARREDEEISERQFRRWSRKRSSSTRTR
jgi:AbrB family looped-hinge helix DNA binding protein